MKVVTTSSSLIFQSLSLPLFHRFLLDYDLSLQQMDVRSLEKQKSRNSVLVDCRKFSTNDNFSASYLFSPCSKSRFSPLKYGFSYPLFVTSFHMVVQFILSSATLTLSHRCCGIELVPRRVNGGRASPTLKDWR